VHQDVSLLAEHHLQNKLSPLPVCKLVGGLECFVKGLFIYTFSISDVPPDAELFQKMRRRAVQLCCVGQALYGLKDVNSPHVGFFGQDSRLGVQYSTSLAGTLCGEQCILHDNELTNSRSQSAVVVTSARGTRHAHDTEGQEWYGSAVFAAGHFILSCSL